MNLLLRPEYTSTVGVTREEWIAQNDDDLRDWFARCGDAAPLEAPEDPAEFWMFCDAQYELAVLEDEQFAELEDFNNRVDAAMSDEVYA
jgi:hypothetical protein